MKGSYVSPLAATRSTRPAPSDADLLKSLREGRPRSFRLIHHRHYHAVYAYAATCVVTPEAAEDLTQWAFQALFDKTRATTTPTHAYHASRCLRLELLEHVRSRAIAYTRTATGVLTPAFGLWVDRGCQWSMADDGQLTLAFSQLPVHSQRLIWHTVAEHDEPLAIARITGIDSTSLGTATQQALTQLRRVRAHHYLSRTQRPGCPHGHEIRLPLPAVPLAHDDETLGLESCTTCDADAVLFALDARLEIQLPTSLLGWWPGEHYRRAKHFAPLKPAELPFLPRSTLPGPAHRRPSIPLPIRPPGDDARHQTLVVTLSVVLLLATCMLSYILSRTGTL